MIWDLKIESWKHRILYLKKREYIHFCNNIWQRMAPTVTQYQPHKQIGMIFGNLAVLVQCD